MPPYRRNITLAQLQKEFDDTLNIWRRSKCREDLLEIVASNKPSEGWRFDKIVCLGSGSFIDIYFGHEGRSMYQVACVVDLATELKNCGYAGDAGIQVFAQEPDYTPAAIDLLTGQGVKILKVYSDDEHTNVALEHFGPHTLPFEFFVPKSLPMMEHFYGSENGMHVGVDARWIRESTLAGEQLKVLDKFIREYLSYAFPKFEAHGDAYKWLAIYWRKSEVTTRPDRAMIRHGDQDRDKEAGMSSGRAGQSLRRRWEVDRGGSPSRLQPDHYVAGLWSMMVRSFKQS